MKQRRLFERARTEVCIVLLASVALLMITGWSTNASTAGGVRVKLKPQGKTVAQQAKVVDQGVSYPNQPIEIIEVNIGGRAVRLSEGIKVDPETEWLKGLSWKITNRSKKNILAIDLFLVFPDTEIKLEPFAHLPDALRRRSAVESRLKTEGPTNQTE